MIGGLTWATLLGAAAVDSINPCTLAVQIILLSTIVAVGKRMKILTAGLSFTLAIFLSYYFMGLGLYTAIQATKLVHVFYYAAGTLAVIIGLVNIKGFFSYKPGMTSIEIPVKWRPTLKKILSKVTSWYGAIVLGVFCSLFLLPCSSGPYLVILGLLAKSSTRFVAMFLLFIYNFIFVLPMIVITLLIFTGSTTVQKASRWREKNIRLLHLIEGIIMLGLGILLFVGMGLGWI